MLPIKVRTVNKEKIKELAKELLTKKGQVAVTEYKTKQLTKGVKHA